MRLTYCIEMEARGEPRDSLVGVIESALAGKRAALLARQDHLISVQRHRQRIPPSKSIGTPCLSLGIPCIKGDLEVARYWHPHTLASLILPDRNDAGPNVIALHLDAITAPLTRVECDLERGAL